MVSILHPRGADWKIDFPAETDSGAHKKHTSPGKSHKDWKGRDGKWYSMQMESERKQT